MDPFDTNILDPVSLPRGDGPRGRVERSRTGWLPRAALALAAVAAVGLNILAIRTQSLSGDEAAHLAAGHQALRYGRNLANLEHPPLVKLVAALPTLLEDETFLEPMTARDWRQRTIDMHSRPDVLRRVVVRSRALVLLLFGLPLALACYSLGEEARGPRTGLVLALMLCLSFSVLPYLGLLLTDAPVTLAFVAVALLTVRYVERPRLRTAAGLGLMLGLGLAVKFSAVLLLPAVALALVLASYRHPVLNRIGHGMIIALLSLVVLAVVYWIANRNLDPATGTDLIRDYTRNDSSVTVGDHLVALEPFLLRLEFWVPALAQWPTGAAAVAAQNQIGVYLSYAFGDLDRYGRWWYFPALFGVQTPLLVLLPLALSPLLLLRGRRSRRRPAQPLRAWIPTLSIAVVYLAAALVSNYNIGYRHLLPVLPILFLPAAATVARSQLLVTAVPLLLAAESVMLAPSWMSATNTWWLGDRNPTARSLSSMEYRQSFATLAAEVEERELDSLQVVYPVLEPEVLTAYLPEARLVGRRQALRPGWLAVNLQAEQLVPAILVTPAERLYNAQALSGIAARYQPILDAAHRGEDHGWVAGTFHLYHLDAADLERP